MQNSVPDEQSFERLDETRPEKAKRSMFDRLFGEKSEEEKLREKLDKDLKEAARKRAEQFEEEEREKEKREVAETKKLKKRWRRKLVEKSQQRLDKAAEKSDEATDGYEIAKLMVAERIVAYHAMLDDESLDLRRSEAKAIKIRIDFMGLLSEKLDRPDLEVPPEVEQLYQTIADSIEEDSPNTVGPDRITKGTVLDPSALQEQQKEVAPASEQETTYVAFAGSIVKALKRALRSQATPPPAGIGSGVSSSGENATATNQQPTSANRQVESLLSIVQNEAQSSQDLRAEVKKDSNIRRLAEATHQVDDTIRKLVEPARPELTPVSKSYSTSTPPSRIATNHMAMSQHSMHRTETRSPVLPERSAPRQEVTQNTSVINAKEFRVPSGAKIDRMTEQQLRSLAKTVDIGHGRSLFDAYVRGEVDKSGLIAVLKSRKKRRNHTQEFVRQQTKFRRLKMQPKTPIEYAPSSPNQEQSTGQPNESANTPRHASTSTVPGSFAPQPQANTANYTPDDDRLTRATIEKRARETQRRLKNQQDILRLVSVVIVVLVLIVAIALWTL
jgi:hypothetical protein